MGFSNDTSTTVDADLLKYFFEQQVSKLLRAGNTFTALHDGVITEHIAWLKSTRGVDPSTITNTDDHKPLICAMILEKIFAGMARPQAGEKASYYAGKVEDLRKSLPIVTTTTTMSRRGLPVLTNFDRGTRFPAAGVGKGSQIGRTKISNFDNRVIEGAEGPPWGSP